MLSPLQNTSISTIFSYKKIGIEIPKLIENLIEDIIKTQL